MQQQWSATDRLGGIKVASKPKTKMPISERAKQFMPFSALKGLDEAIAKKEEEHLKIIESCKEQTNNQGS